jgi:Zn finger protein HypA/HybF involved in hydrogenase expression
MAHSQEYLAYLRSEAWQRKRAKVLARAEGRCQSCRRQYPRLEVHHKHYRTLSDEDAVLDLIALCPDCHGRKDKVRTFEDASEREEQSALESDGLDAHAVKASPMCPYCGQSRGVIESDELGPVDIRFRCPVCRKLWWRDSQSEIVMDGDKEKRIYR